MKKIFTLFFSLAVVIAKAQVNGYAKVTAIAGPALTVTGADETYDQFLAGEQVLVLQMQENVIGSNTGNNSNFGDLSAIGNAGKYEVATIVSVTRTGGIPALITLTGPLNNSYNTDANSSVQVVTFPTLGGGNYTTTAAISAVPWNGAIGGVVAFSVNGILTLNHNITASYAGFRGGAADDGSSSGSCNSGPFFNAVHANYGNKGEGIYKVTNTNYTSGKGKILNGGGGGNPHNSGGGGGGNYTAGGDGYFGWNCSSGTGGIGGIALNAHIAGNRLFMGGGGGSGEANNNSNDKGGNGGGIIIINANVIRTTGSGAAIQISANGQNANNVSNDGAGGGGAGGSVVLNVSSWNVSASKPLVITANGGNGGNVGSGSQHGGGGGGGQGVVMFSTPVPVTNITTSTGNGTGGLNSTGGSSAGDGEGSDNTGIVSSATIVLPLRLLSFSGEKSSQGTLLTWTTTGERNVHHFEIERSLNGRDFEKTATRNAAGSTQSVHTYSYTDQQLVNAVTYYRLRIVDYDGKYTYSNILMIRGNNTGKTELSVYPNPAVSSATLWLYTDVPGEAVIRVMDMKGAVRYSGRSRVLKGSNTIPVQSVDQLSAGVYTIRVTVNNETYYTRLLISK